MKMPLTHISCWETLVPYMKGGFIDGQALGEET
jgi:hypothetical protein